MKFHLIYKAVVFLITFGIPVDLIAQISVTLESTGATCGYNNGAIYAVVTGGTEPFSFRDNGGASQNSALFTKLPPGSHTISVIDADGKTASSTVILTNTFQHPTFTVSANSNPTDCNVDGSLTITAAGGVGPYKYSLEGSQFQTSPSFSNMTAGRYNLYIVDKNNCYTSIGFTFVNNCIVKVSLSFSPTACTNDGWLSVTPGPTGQQPFTYSIDGGQYTGNTFFAGLSSGMHRLNTKDANGIVSVNSFQIGKHCDLPVAATTVRSRCSNNDGSIAVTVTGGRTPIFYAIAGRDFQQSNTIADLAPGNYTVQVKDANGSVGELPDVIVGQYCPVLKVAATPSGCGVNTGTITVTEASGGTNPVKFSINGTTFQTGKTFTGLAPGNYTITSKDAANILTTATATVSTANGPTLTANFAEAGCTVFNGSITSSATGGRTPYKFQLNNGTAQPTGNFTNLKAGDYQLKVTDANNCAAQQTITIPLAASPTIQTFPTVAGCTVSNGTITALASGGHTPYSYQLDNRPSQTTNLFNSLGAGNYTVKVSDVNGCTAQLLTTIATTPDGPTLLASPAPASCANDDGRINASATGGLSPYSFSLDNSAYQSSGDFTGLSSKNYSVAVKDANGCAATQNVEVSFSNSIAVDAGADREICLGDTVVLHGTSSATNISWSPAAGLDDIHSLSPTAKPNSTTTYYLDASSGICTGTDSVQVIVHALPVPDAGRDTVTCFEENISLHGSGGTSFSWSPAVYLNNDQSQDPTLITPRETITYSLTVKDENGCVSGTPDQVTIRVIPKPVVFAGNDTSILANSNFVLHATDVNNSGFVSYQWSPLTGMDNPDQQNPTINLSLGETFTVTATTANSCSATDDIRISVYKTADILVPNAFSPNGDGRNDLLHAIPQGIRDFHYFKLMNRYGQLVFQTKDPGQGWDGRIAGQYQTSAAYVWQAEGIDYTGKLIQRRGTVVLVR